MISVDVCVRNKSGNLTRTCRHLEIDEAISIECEVGYVADYPNNRVRINGDYFTIISHGEMVGNMLWDSLQVDAKTAAEMIESVRRSVFSACISGYTELFDKWDTDERYVDDDLAEVEIDAPTARSDGDSDGREG